jgi:hypothetical protein
LEYKFRAIYSQVSAYNWYSGKLGNFLGAPAKVKNFKVYRNFFFAEHYSNERRKLILINIKNIITSLKLKDIYFWQRRYVSKNHHKNFDLKKDALYNNPKLFNLESIDLDNRGIGLGGLKIGLLSKDTAESLNNLVSYPGFWTILCTCVGQKHLKKKDNPVLKAISERLNPALLLDFTTIPAVQTACRRYHTDFANMWTYDRYQSDLHVTILLLLRIHLAKQRFLSRKANV